MSDIIAQWHYGVERDADDEVIEILPTGCYLVRSDKVEMPQKGGEE